MNIFKVENKDMPNLLKFMKDYPSSMKYATASVLNSLAFTTKKLNEQEIKSSMTIRNLGFVGSMLKYEKTRAVNIAAQMAKAGSVKKDNFSGWTEQEKGVKPAKKRAATIAARGGSFNKKMMPKSKFMSKNKFHKLSDFRAKTPKESFMFMLRVLGSRGGGEFLINEPVPTKRGTLARGLYTLQKHRIKKLQKMDDIKPIRHNTWMQRSIAELPKHTGEAWNSYIKYHNEMIAKRGLKK
jgi:hypothetical protein